MSLQAAATVMDLAINRDRALAVIDVDEVLGLFVQGFDRYLRGHGYELRMTSFALFTNLYAAGGVEPMSFAEGKRLFDHFFATGCGEIEPAPFAGESLARLARSAQVVILTNAPEASRVLRGQWLQRHGMDYPLLIGSGLKGEGVAALAARTRGKTLFVDDLLGNLNSVAEAAPAVRTFQMVADPHLRLLAPSDPRHPRFDQWPDLVEAAEDFLRG